MKSNLDVGKCRAAAEELFGHALASFRELHGGKTSRNFVAADGDRQWFVKVGLPKRVERTLSRHQAVRSPLVPRIALDGRTAVCGDCVVCAEEWLPDLTHVDPAELTPPQAEDLVRAYRDFSAAAQAVRDAKDDGRYRAFDAGLTPSVIHGDLNFRNVGFSEGRVRAILDLESMRLGYPTEDLLGFVVHEMERTRLWFRRRLRRLEQGLAAVVRASGYTRRAWLAAIDTYEADKRSRRAGKSRFTLFKTLEHHLRAPLYRQIRRIIEREALPC